MVANKDVDYTRNYNPSTLKKKKDEGTQGD